VREEDYALFREAAGGARVTTGVALGHAVTLVAGLPGLLGDLARQDGRRRHGPEPLIPREVAPLAGDGDWAVFLAEAGQAGMSRSGALAVLVHSYARGALRVEIRVVPVLPGYSRPDGQ
jgi:hypothetical protein